MFSVFIGDWNATPTTWPSLIAGPPLFPLLMAASTVTTRFASRHSDYMDQFIRETNPLEIQTLLPPSG
jgi:hypothetical protein